MTRLGQASVVRLGTQVVSRIYAGAKQAWPLPYLDPSIGVATTPDTANLDVGIGTIRWTFQARSTKDVYDAVDQFIAGQWTSSAVGAWFAGYRPANGGFILGTIDTASVRRDILAIPTINFNKNVPLWFRVELTPQIDATHSQLKGFMSNDYGETWTLITTDTSYPPLLEGLRDSTAVLTVGSHGATPRWAGQVYSVQAEKINRAQLIFPGRPGNWATTPYTATGQVPTGDFEIVARVSRPDWANAGGVAAGIVLGKNGSWYFLVNEKIHLWSTTTGGSTFPASTNPHGFANGAIGWIKATRVVATGVTSFYSAPDSEREPTVWTARGTNAAYAGSALVNPANQVVGMGNYSTAGNPLNGRVLRVILRDGIAGPTLIDVNEDDAGVMVTPTTFTSRSGHTFTVVERQPVIFNFPGTVNDYLSVPDSAALDITGDIDITARVEPSSWRPVGGMDINAKYLATGNQRVWRFVLNASGSLGAWFSGDGITPSTGANSSVTLPTPGGPLWLRMTRQGTVVKFYTAPDATAEPTTWTQLGTDRVTGIAGTLFVATSPLTIGGIPAGGGGGIGPYSGRIRQTIVRNGIAGTIVANVHEDNATVGATSFAATTGGTVTVVNSAGSFVQSDLVTPASDIVQPQPNQLLWRFDPDDHTSGTTWTDPRGRAWTLSAAGTIVRPSAPT